MRWQRREWSLLLHDRAITGGDRIVVMRGYAPVMDENPDLSRGPKVDFLLRARGPERGCRPQLKDHGSS